MFTEHKGLQHIIDQKELTKSQRRWVEWLNDYECEIRHHPGKANVVVDALSKKERAKSLHIKALTLTIRSNLTTQIRFAQMEALKPENIVEENLRGMDN